MNDDYVYIDSSLSDIIDDVKNIQKELHTLKEDVNVIKEENSRLRNILLRSGIPFHFTPEKYILK